MILQVSLIGSLLLHKLVQSALGLFGNGLRLIDFLAFGGKEYGLNQCPGQQNTLPANDPFLPLFLAGGVFPHGVFPCPGGAIAVHRHKINIVAHDFVPVGKQHLVDIVLVHQFQTIKAVNQLLRQLDDIGLNFRIFINAPKAGIHHLHPRIKGIVDALGVGRKRLVVIDHVADILFGNVQPIIAIPQLRKQLVFQTGEQYPILLHGIHICRRNTAMQMSINVL